MPRLLQPTARSVLREFKAVGGKLITAIMWSEVNKEKAAAKSDRQSSVRGVTIPSTMKVEVLIKTSIKMKETDYIFI
jgi:hypothetical protein